MAQPVQYQDLELSDLHLDALREICNIGMGNAATALNRMIGKTIQLSVPEVSLVPLTEIPELIGGLDQKVAGIFLQIRGEIQGNILLIFPYPSVQALCRLLTGVAPGDEPFLSEMHSSVIREVGNILASSFLAALERLLNRSLFPSVPGVAFDMAGAIIQSVLTRVGEELDWTLVVRADFFGREEKVRGHFYLLPDPKSLRLILQAAKVLAVEEPPV